MVPGGHLPGRAELPSAEGRPDDSVVAEPREGMAGRLWLG